MTTSHNTLLAAFTYCGVLLLSYSKVADAQPTWTQISLPNVSACSTTDTSPYSYTTGCLMGSTTEPSEPSLASTSNPDVIVPAGISFSGNGEYTTSDGSTLCYYPNGTQQEYSGPNVWEYDSHNAWTRPGQAQVTNAAYYLYSNYIGSSSSGYGIAVEADFQGSASAGTAGAVFFSDNPCFSGGREYGLEYDFNASTTALYWQANANCGVSGVGDGVICFTDSSYTTALPSQTNNCVINTSDIPPSTQWIYELYFTSNIGSFNANCVIYDSGLTPYTTHNPFTTKSGWTWDSTTGVYSGPLDSWFVAPELQSAPGAGYYYATVDSTAVPVTTTGTCANDGGASVACMDVYLVDVAK